MPKKKYPPQKTKSSMPTSQTNEATPNFIQRNSEILRLGGAFSFGIGCAWTFFYFWYSEKKEQIERDYQTKLEQNDKNWENKVEISKMQVRQDEQTKHLIDIDPTSEQGKVLLQVIKKMNRYEK